jgi:hypothetical protein
MERIEINVATGEKTVIQLTDDEVTAAQAAESARIAAISYRELRAAAYPSFADQFDSIFHGGLDAWKAEIQAVKTQFPKGE